MPAEQQQVDPPAMDWELAADEVIATFGGDPREAVKALLAANASLEREGGAVGSSGELWVQPGVA